MIRRLIQLILDQQAARKLEREVGRTMRKVARDSESTVTKAFRRIGGVIVAAFSVRALVRFTKEMFRLGSSAEETASKFRTVFGEQRARELDTFLDGFSRLAGLTKSAGRDMLANFGAVLQGAGIAADASAQMSESLVRLTGDLTSFNDVPIEQAFAAIRSGVTGESEPLKRFGIVLRAVEVDQRALLNTGKETTKALTEQDRVVARTQLIYEKAGKAVGDLARTQDSAANRARRLNARFAQARETIAVGLLPALERLIPIFEELATKAERFANKTAGAVQALLDLAGIARQEVAIEVESITRQLRLMDEAQQQAFLTNRLQRAAAEYQTLRDRIVAAQRAMFDATPAFERVGKSVEDMTNRSIRSMQEQMETAGAVMNAISRMLADNVPAPAAPPGGPQGIPAAVFGAAPELDTDFLGDVAITIEDELRSIRDIIDDTDAFAGLVDQTAATAAFMRDGFKGVGQQITRDLIVGRAGAEFAAGLAALAAGIWPPNPAAIAASAKHFAAAAAFRAVGSQLGGGGTRTSSGVRGGVPPGGIGSSAPATQQVPPAEINIWIDPLSADDARAQRLVLGAMQNATERFGSNVQVNVRPRTGN